MTSIIRVGQSKFVTVPIDEDSHERILNCIWTLSKLEEKPTVHEIFLKDTKAAYSKMLGAQEVNAHMQYVTIILADGFGSGKGCGTEGCGEHQGCHCAG